MEFIPIGEGGIVGLLVTVLIGLVLMLFRGTIVTRREVDAKDEEIQFLRETNREQVEQLKLLAEVGKTVEQLARGLQQEMRQ